MAFLCPMFPRRRKKRKGNDTKSSVQNGIPKIQISTNKSQVSLVGNGKGEDPEEIDFEPRKMVVLHDFIPCVEDEIAVKRGEHIKTLYQETDWIYIINSRNKEGFIPFTYCIPEDEYERRKEKQKANGLSRKNFRNASFMDSMESSHDSGSHFVTNFSKANFGEFVVRFDFVATAEDDISAKKGEFVVVLNTEDPDWYWVAKRNGHEGFIPKDFIVKADQISVHRSLSGDASSKSSQSSTSTSGQSSPISPMFLNNTGTPYNRICDTTSTNVDTMATTFDTLSTRLDSLTTSAVVMATPKDTVLAKSDSVSKTSSAIGRNPGSNTSTGAISSLRDDSVFLYMDPLSATLKTAVMDKTNKSVTNSMNSAVNRLTTPVNVTNRMETTETEMDATEFTQVTPLDHVRNVKETQIPSTAISSRTNASVTSVDRLENGIETRGHYSDAIALSRDGLSNTQTSTPVVPLAYQPATASRLGEPGIAQHPNRRNSNDLMIYGQELVCIDTYIAQQEDELTVYKGDWVYADMEHKDHRGGIWACSPTTSNQGFVPKACLRPPATTPL